ncbi:unnamed protein product [Zymoseptoria tritici ST99CH_1A5]|uniref:DUF7918 domain-containing protein n=1 Tax=Zymoseptoria tritici ST99CH_1A5 TaxID=1276529 RepID=A0A1Y6L696_ZYMTR|nr:unnamed protein product [Zymoseptoria tritici ST99CH_1A5]
MPTLKQITTSIELGSGDTRLKEYDHRFTDGAVECFILAPETDIPFHVRITTSGYIAPGLAAYVFIDGEYQCNRNRLCLEVPGDGVDPVEYEIDLKLRQKEEKTSDGCFVARDWFFTPLKTGIADSEPNASRNWSKNVGTIEVIVLRCKQGGEKETGIDPAETVIATVPSAGRDILRAINKSSAPPKQPTSKDKEQSKDSKPKASSKAPSKAPSKKGSVVMSDVGFGGMMGLFDGAGDEPGYYKKYRPRNMVGQPYLPGHRFDDTTGRYRYYEEEDPFVRGDSRARHEQEQRAPDHRYEPYTYTVGGGFDDNDRTPSTRSGPKRVVPRTSPSPVIDESKRRRGRGVVFDIPTRSSSHHNITRRAQSPDKPRGRSRQPHRSSVFIDEASDHMQVLQRIAFEEAEKYDALWEDIDTFKTREDAHKGMMTTLRRKYDEIQAVLDELRDLNASISACMEDMNRMEWKQTYDTLFDKGLVPSPRIALRHPDGEKADAEKDDKEKKSDGWEQVGDGAVGDKDKPADNNGWDSSSHQNDSAEKANDGWNQDENKSNKSNKSNNNADWGGGDQKSNGSKKSNSGGWGDEKKDEQQNGGNDGWDKDNDDAGNNGGNAWGDAPADNAAENNDEWGEKKSDKPKSGSKAASNHRPSKSTTGRSTTSTSSTVQPHAEIKPYWKSWATKPAAASKLRLPFRDPYKYPAPPTPAVPASKAKDIKYGVQAGRGADYAHKHYRPEYLDSMEKPYAVFTFKYRSREALEKIVGKGKVREGGIGEAEKVAEKERLMRTPKDELVAELLRKRGVPEKKALSRVAASEVSAAEEVRATREGVAKARSKAASKKDAGGDGWGGPAQAADDGWGAESNGGKSNDGWASAVKPEDSVSHTGRGKAKSKTSTVNHWNDAEGMETTKGGGGGGGGDGGPKW